MPSQRQRLGGTHLRRIVAGIGQVIVERETAIGKLPRGGRGDDAFRQPRVLDRGQPAQPCRQVADFVVTQVLERMDRHAEGKMAVVRPALMQQFRNAGIVVQRAALGEVRCDDPVPARQLQVHATAAAIAFMATIAADAGGDAQALRRISRG